MSVCTAITLPSAEIQQPRGRSIGRGYPHRRVPSAHVLHAEGPVAGVGGDAAAAAVGVDRGGVERADILPVLLRRGQAPGLDPGVGPWQAAEGRRNGLTPRANGSEAWKSSGSALRCRWSCHGRTARTAPRRSASGGFDRMTATWPSADRTVRATQSGIGSLGVNLKTCLPSASSRPVSMSPWRERRV